MSIENVSYYEDFAEIEKKFGVYWLEPLMTETLNSEHQFLFVVITTTLMEE